MVMERSLDALWKRRAGSFWREAAPYLQYMAQSGFPGFLILTLIVAFIGYGAFLKHVPADFPITAAGVAVLVPLICRSPLRTWLVQADVVFLMPRESEMKRYIGRSYRYGIIPGLLLVLAALAVYIPLYAKGQGTKGWLLLAVVAALLNAGNQFGAWRERKMVWAAARRGFRLMRWVITALTIVALLEQPFWKTCVLTLLLAAVYAAASRYPLRHSFPWERLIAEEERTRRRYYRFFSAFIDVPVMASRVSKRLYLTWLAGWIPRHKRHTFTYLYTVSLLRTELGGMLMRLTVLGMLVSFVAGEAELLSGWGAAALCFFFVLIIGIQLGSLHHVHKHSVWRHVYPLPESRREASLVTVVRFSHTVSTLFVWLPLAVSLGLAGNYTVAAAALVVCLVYTLWLRPARLRRSMAKDLDDL